MGEDGATISFKAGSRKMVAAGRLLLAALACVLHRGDVGLELAVHVGAVLPPLLALGGLETVLAGEVMCSPRLRASAARASQVHT